MDPELTSWVAEQAIAAVRVGTSLPPGAAYELGGMPFVDPLRAKVRSEDKAHLLRMVSSDRWSDRYLAVNISRPILDEEIAGTIRARWREEPHFHTQLAMIYLLLHAGASRDDIRLFVTQLEARRDEFMPCIAKFYEKAEGGTWGGLTGRLADAKFAGARPIYLLSLALLAEDPTQPVAGLPGLVHELAQDEDRLTSDLAARLITAVRAREKTDE